MYDAAVECDAIARIHLPTSHAKLISVGIDVREWFPVTFKIYSVNIRLLVWIEFSEILLAKIVLPKVGSRYKRQCAYFGNWDQRHPNADCIQTFS